MKQDALLKTTSFQGLCLSCACRLAASSITSSGRQYAFRRSPHQFATKRRPDKPQYGRTGSRRWQSTVALSSSNDLPFGLGPPRREQASDDTVRYDEAVRATAVKPLIIEKIEPETPHRTKRPRRIKPSIHASAIPTTPSAATTRTKRQASAPVAEAQLDNAVNAVLSLAPAKHIPPPSDAQDAMQPAARSSVIATSSALTTMPLVSRVPSRGDNAKHARQSAVNGPEDRDRDRTRKIVLHRLKELPQRSPADNRSHAARRSSAFKQMLTSTIAELGTTPSKAASTNRDPQIVLPMEGIQARKPRRNQQIQRVERQQLSPTSSLVEQPSVQLAIDTSKDRSAEVKVQVESVAASSTGVDDRAGHEQHYDALTLPERQAAQTERQPMAASRSAAAWGGILSGAAPIESRELPTTKQPNPEVKDHDEQVPAQVVVDLRPDLRQQTNVEDALSKNDANTYTQRSPSKATAAPPISDISQIQSEASALFQRVMQQVIDERRNPPPGVRRPALPRAFDQRRYMSTTSSLRRSQSVERERHDETARPKFQIRQTQTEPPSKGRYSKILQIRHLPTGKGFRQRQQKPDIPLHTSTRTPWSTNAWIGTNERRLDLTSHNQEIRPDDESTSAWIGTNERRLDLARNKQEFRPDDESTDMEAVRKVKTDTREGEIEPRFTSELAESTSLLSRLSKRFATDDDTETAVERQRKRSTKSDNDDRTRRRTSRFDASEEEDVGRRRRKDAYEDDPAEVKRRQEKAAEQQRKYREKIAAAAARRAADGKPITIPPFVTVTNLAQLVGAHYTHFSNRLKSLGFDDIFANKVLDAETAALIAQEYGLNPSQDSAQTESIKRDLIPEPEPDAADAFNLPQRPPVVTIMGHVDHGKTTILDFLRKANVVAGEAGGITQHIGAFSVTLPATGRTITFLDTPGHAAFLAMRQRGANVTDIVVLVVAADDSVMPQTLEAIKHASAAQVPIIVAINKVDKPEANIMKVKQDLGRHGIEIEDFGGEVQVVEVSGKTGQGMAELEEAIVTQAELLDRRADTESSIDGWVIEATTKAAGRVATVLVRRGTVRPGSILVAGRTWCRVRVLRDDAGRELLEAPPGTPVAIDGWREQPVAGDRTLEAEDEQQAASVVDYRQELVERERLAEDTEAINKFRHEHQVARERTKAGSEEDEVASAGYVEEETGQQIIPIVIKADVSGSAEAVAAYIGNVGNAMIAPKVLQSNVGAITESDIEYAAAVGGLIIGFNVETEERIKALAAVRKVQLLENNIIYRVTEDVREFLESKLAATIVQKVTGEAEVAQGFEISIGKGKKVKIAGCKVRNGVIARNSRVRVMRDTAKIFDGTLSSLKNVKKDVDEMRKGTECGISFNDWSDFQAGDVVQAYSETTEKRKL